MCDQYECPKCLNNWRECNCVEMQKSTTYGPIKPSDGWVKTLDYLQKEIDKRNAKKDNTTILPYNCTTCNDAICLHHGKNKSACAKWVRDLKNKEEGMEKKCDTCKHKGGSIYLGKCIACELWPYRSFKNNWEAATPELPEKNKNLTWQEADKLQTEGWEVRRKCWDVRRKYWDPSPSIWDDTSCWPLTDIRATDYYIVGRKK